MVSPFDTAWMLLKENTIPYMEPLNTVASTGEKRPKYVGFKKPLPFNGYYPLQVGLGKQGPKTPLELSNAYRPKGPPPPEGPVGMGDPNIVRQ